MEFVFSCLGRGLCLAETVWAGSRERFLVLVLVLHNKYEQDKESFSVVALGCLCQTGLTPWSVSLLFHRTILIFLPLCKIMGY